MTNVQQVRKVIDTECPTCEAPPGYACFPGARLLEETMFHAARLMAADFGDED